MEDSKRAPRRRHAAELKLRVLGECAEPGTSVAQVAMAHGLNANLVHKWRRQTERRNAAAPMPAASAFIPLALPQVAPSVPGNIRLELRRGATAVNVTWPVASAAHCAAWLREVLK